MPTRSPAAGPALAGLALSLALAWLPGPAPGHAAEIGAPAPDFRGDLWLNGGPRTLQTEQGKAVLVYFWTFGCHNCRAVQPHVKGWYGDYRKDGLQVVAVHAPELPYERDVDSVRRFVAEHGLTYPVVIDNDFAIWRRYRNHYWPVIYLIDRQGRLRYRHIGEGQYDETRRWIERLLAEEVNGPR